MIDATRPDPTVRPPSLVYGFYATITNDGFSLSDVADIAHLSRFFHNGKFFRAILEPMANISLKLRLFRTVSNNRQLVSV
jgi:hypothetical protein